MDVPLLGRGGGNKSISEENSGRLWRFYKTEQIIETNNAFPAVH